MSGDLSISEAVKLRRRTSTANSILVKEIAAADEKVLRLRRKLRSKRKKKARPTRSSSQSGDSGKLSIEEVGLRCSAFTALQSVDLVQREFSLPASFTSLKTSLRPGENEQSDGSVLGPSQLLDLINEDCSPVRPGRPVLYCENKSSGDKILGKIRDSQLSLWSQTDGENFVNIFEAKLDRRLADPVLVCSGETFTIREFFAEGDEVKLFRFSVQDHGGKPAVTSSKTSVLITEKTDIQDLHCLEVGDERTVISYNISGRSRVHLVTTVEDRAEVELLGHVETEVRDLCLLHGPDKMFLCLCDSRLIIWNLTDRRFLSKPVFRLPSRILGAFLVKTNLCFVVHDGEEVKLSIVENQRLKDLMRVHVGDDSLLSLLSVKEDILTFLGDQSVFRLHLDTSEIVSETLF